MRSWIKRADSQAKPIVEIVRVFQEEAFPGFGHFISSLSAIEALPFGWLSALRSARGVYLLTCPRTREQYVGSATGESDFLVRGLSYVQNSHGGNIGLKSGLMGKAARIAASLASLLACASFLGLRAIVPVGRSITFPVIGLTSARRRRRLPGSWGLRIE